MIESKCPCELFNKLLSKSFLESLIVFDLLRTELLLMKIVLFLSLKHVPTRNVSTYVNIQDETFFLVYRADLLKTCIFENLEHDLSLNTAQLFVLS